MKTFILIACFFFLGALPLAAQWNTYNLLQQGKSAIYFDNHVSAIENFNNIIRIKPYLSEPYFFRGLAKMNLDDYEGAVQDYSTAIELNPNYFFAYMYRGIAYHNLRRFDDAMKDYDEAIVIDPGNAYVYANRGMTKAQMGDCEGAEKDYSKSLMIDNSIQAAYLNRAIMRERLEDIEGAMADCNAVIKLNMFSDDAYGLRGYLYYKQEDYFNALEDFNRAIKANPENVRILMNRALVNYEMKNFQGTLDDYQRILEVDSNYIFAYYNRAMLRSEIGDYNNALLDLDKVIEMNPDNILIFFNRGLLRYQLGDLYGAYNDFSESIRLYPDFVKAYLVRAAVSSDLQNYSSAQNDHYMAQDIMERYQKMKSGDKNALVDTTENFQRLIDFNARGDAMRDIVNGRIQDRHVIVSLQEIFYVQYMSTDSLRTGKVQYYNKHVMQYNQEHNYSHALTITNKKNTYSPLYVEQMIEQYDKAMPKSENIDDYMIRGIFYMNNLEYPKAIEDFQTITEQEPNNVLAVFNKANARMQMLDYIESVDDRTNQIIGNTEQEVKVKRMVDYSEVLEDYYKCLEIDPSFVFAWFNIGNVYVKSEEIERAIEIYTRVIEMDRDIAEAYFNRGLLYIYVGRKAEANVDLSRAGEKGIVDAYNIIKRYCNE
ncbi:MAG: tetratricopeptide repeat protein [Odoribacter sp.]|nr:tetratricopeptide repeat protein [Odoribacter sp.]